MTDGIKPEYWDFIFESFDPYCDIKLTDLISIYFSIAENEAKNSYDFIRFLKTNKKTIVNGLAIINGRRMCSY